MVFPNHCNSTRKLIRYWTGVERGPSESTKIIEECVNSGTWCRDRIKASSGIRLIQGNRVENCVARGKVIIIDLTKKGNSYSWNALGDHVSHVPGLGKDITKEKEFYRKAIDSGNGIQGVLASYTAMGEIFEYGDGVTASILKSNNHYLLEAGHLSSRAQ